MALKHIFVVNPVSGKNIKTDFVNELIIPACEKAGVDYEIYTTKEAGDGIRFVDETATAAGDAPVRFYAVGGDGTLYEVVNGAFGHKNAQVGVVPKGSGNDWIRLFGDRDLFLDIEGQLEGTPYVVDCLRAGDEIAINQASMGFDAETCSLQGKMKSVPGAVGHATYFLAGLYCMLTRVWHDFDVEIDGKKIEGPFIQAVGANSRWYGSGIMEAPFAMPDDHLLDFVIFRRTSSWPAMFYPMMVNWQMKGDHVKYGFVEYYRGKKMTIKARKPSQINVDGECHAVDGTTLELIEDGLTFVIPRDSKYFEQKASGELNNNIKVGPRNKGPLKLMTSQYTPFNILINHGLLRLLNKDRNYLK
ncbi:MAG: hypothetical protein J6T14_06520 [Clostridia bacterium]|nr:hypothetical protein [Clostridia bacterium]